MNRIYFIGIGGIGMSSLARYYLSQGYKVSGSDLAKSEITDSLKKEGVDLFIGHNSKNIKNNFDSVVYSSAIKKNNPELKEAKKFKIPTLTYAESLGELTKQYITLAVSGSHGKSTTTALLSLMMIEAGLDPTVIVGTRLKEFGGSNFRLGKSRYLIIEADEWNNSFHQYKPTIVTVTNIDKEHLDTFENLQGVINGFNKYLNNIAPQGKVFINAKDKNSIQATKGIVAETFLYNKKAFSKWPLKIPGEFNQLNAEAAWQVAESLGVSKKDARSAVKKFTGSWRRMEFLLPKPETKLCKLCVYINDYAHHPSEIKVVGKGIKQAYPKKKSVVIFQPHQIERLTNLYGDFKKSFSDFDVIVIMPTYEVVGRELEGGKTSENLFNDLRKKKRSYHLQNFEDVLSLIRELRQEFKKEKLVVTFMGAGDIDQEVRKYFDSKLLPA
ncbi:TPA: hypothetical protein DGT35_00370 [Patescibacteria group bacterium]|jgi:UDP-N-acetylmuramate--alanine ligase|nr:hypothetical protein [Patescibacteria group bacterium]|tara:strand:+ start:7342 stop:8664 length:1323 start_codon:yes stop_codon:yes gene_type:complete